MHATKRRSLLHSAVGWKALLIFLVAISSVGLADDHFEKVIRPLLIKRCISCHGPGEQKGGLRLDYRSGWQAGGDGGPAIVPQRSNESLLVKAIRGTDGITRMPPKESLSEAEISALTKWIDQGAEDPRSEKQASLGGMNLDDARKWWAFQPIKRPAVPAGPTHPIDAFIRAKQNEQHLSPAPQADKRTLIRRATYDLTGLPPTAEEVNAFPRRRFPQRLFETH